MNNSVEDLKDEIQELRETVLGLRRTVGELTVQLEKTEPVQNKPKEEGLYKVISNQRICVEGDLSWTRLVKHLQDADQGLTATEAASRWGRSRSRTSEVLNKLANKGHVVKYRDGRKIRFRCLED
ncbi:MAG: MarR family transcriptional regulator [Candidatus Thorarchaeota archaeon]|nr:MarR family transcriptional regulator [Candidatus Thorarchaeota archaeon]